MVAGIKLMGESKIQQVGSVLANSSGSAYRAWGGFTAGPPKAKCGPLGGAGSHTQWATVGAISHLRMMTSPLRYSPSGKAIVIG